MMSTRGREAVELAGAEAAEGGIVLAISIIEEMD
jgi:hypothetical protein